MFDNLMYDNLIKNLINSDVGNDYLDRKIATCCEIKWSPDEEGNFGGYDILPSRCHFTRSMTAAISLTPIGWFWDIQNEPMYGGYARITDIPTIGAVMNDINEHSATPELAFCVVALKARRIMDMKGK